MRAPALQRSSQGVSPIVSTVLLVAVTVVLASVLFVIVSSLLTPPPPPPVAVVFDTLGWDAAGNNTAQIKTVTGASAVVVSDLTYIVKDSEGTTYYVGPADVPQTNNSITVTVHYDDRDTGGRITAGDLIVISVAPVSAASLMNGGVLEIYNGNHQIAIHSIS